MEVARFAWVKHRAEPMSPEIRTRIETVRDEMAEQGTRVLGIGFRLCDHRLTRDELEQDFVFVGLVGLSDPPRTEAKEAVASCRKAGIRAIMITGDHKLTAASIAQSLGISTGEDVVSGQELSGMSLDTLQRRVNEVSVFARVAPGTNCRSSKRCNNSGKSSP